MSQAPIKKRRQQQKQINAEHVDKTVKQVARLERQNEEQKGASEWLADHITTFSGSMLYVFLHIIWFTAWIIANSLWFDVDPFPFTFLTMIVSLEAIFLATFVLISQNRQAMLSNKRSQLDLQVNMVTEDELTKLMRMVADVHQHLGIVHDGGDQELDEMLEPTDMEGLASAFEEEQRQHSEDTGRWLEGRLSRGRRH